MPNYLRRLTRRALNVTRVPTYYLPWLTRPGLRCVILVNNIEARFKQGYNEGPFLSSVRQYDANGALVRRYEVALASNSDTAELDLEPTSSGHGFVTVDVSNLHSDLYATLSRGDFYTATHGRHEFLEIYPAFVRMLFAFMGHILALGGRTIPAFRRQQYVFVGRESRSHLLLLNLSNVTNRIRVVPRDSGGHLKDCLLTLPPMGSQFLDVSRFGETARGAPAVTLLQLEGNCWFNLYLVGAGPDDLAGPLSLMHVK